MTTTSLKFYMRKPCKAGFIISGFEVNDSFGTLVQLSYYFNPLRRKMMDVRVGQRKLDEEIRKLF